MEATWEYCALVSHAVESEDGEPGWRCRISYFTADGVRTVQLREPLDPFPTDSFERAMAQLGAGGWELVSLDHELVRTNIAVGEGAFVAAVHTGYGFASFGVAYFKRPVREGRPIDEPAVRGVDSRDIETGSD